MPSKRNRYRARHYRKQRNAKALRGFVNGRAVTLWPTRGVMFSAKDPHVFADADGQLYDFRTMCLAAETQARKQIERDGLGSVRSRDPGYQWNFNPPRMTQDLSAELSPSKR